MDVRESLSHTKCDCKYHLVFIPKCGRKTLYRQLRSGLTSVTISQPAPTTLDYLALYNLV
jgi:REP-associated tyrosine transposase